MAKSIRSGPPPVHASSMPISLASMTWKHRALFGSIQLAWYTTPSGSIRPSRTKRARMGFGSLFLKCSMTMKSMDGNIAEPRSDTQIDWHWVQFRAGGSLRHNGFGTLNEPARSISCILRLQPESCLSISRTDVAGYRHHGLEDHAEHFDGIPVHRADVAHFRLAQKLADCGAGRHLWHSARGVQFSFQLATGQQRPDISRVGWIRAGSAVCFRDCSEAPAHDASRGGAGTADQTAAGSGEADTGSD